MKRKNNKEEDVAKHKGLRQTMPVQCISGARTVGTIALVGWEVGDEIRHKGVAIFCGLSSAGCGCWVVSLTELEGFK